jgi:hypothetical protein
MPLSYLRLDWNTLHTREYIEKNLRELTAGVPVEQSEAGSDDISETYQSHVQSSSSLAHSMKQTGMMKAKTARDHVVKLYATLRSMFLRSAASAGSSESTGREDSCVPAIIVKLAYDRAVEVNYALWETLCGLKHFSLLLINVSFLYLVNVSSRSLDCVAAAGELRMKTDTNVNCSTTTHRVLQKLSWVIIITLGAGLVRPSLRKSEGFAIPADARAANTVRRDRVRRTCARKTQASAGAAVVFEMDRPAGPGDAHILGRNV